MSERQSMFACYPEGHVEGRQVITIEDEDDCPACAYMNRYQEPLDEPITVVVEDENGNISRYLSQLIEIFGLRGCMCHRLE